MSIFTECQLPLIVITNKRTQALKSCAFFILMNFQQNHHKQTASSKCILIT